MIYKSIFLSALLVPFALYNNNNVDTQVKQLRDDLFKKELELSALGKEIETKETLIEDMTRAIARIYAMFSGQEKDKFIADISAFRERFNKAYLINDVKNFLIKELFSDTTDNRILIERIKSLMVRRSIEENILRHLIQQYEIQLQEVAKIDLELIELKDQWAELKEYT